MFKKMINNNLINWFIFIIIVLFLFTFNVASSRYTKNFTSNNDIIAIPIITLDKNQATFEVTDMKPGDIKEYEFIVSNHEGEKINEVSMKYTFNINMQTIIPLSYKIYEINNELGKTRELNITNNQTEQIELPYGENAEDKHYKLCVIWDSKYNKLEYANKKVTGTIELTSISE